MMRDFIALPDKNKNMPVIMDKEVVFLGYGIDDKKYSDYKKAKVADKIIMINHGEPLIKDSISVLTGTKQLSDWSDVDLTKKLMAAKKNGVKLVLIIESDIQKVIDKNRRSILGGTMNLGKVSTDSLETASYVYISTSMAKAIIGQQEEQILKARKKLSKGKRAMVKLNTDLIINLFKEDKSITGYNIVGIVYGKSKPEEYVVMSAHYDHLGKKGDEVFNGADDNGSGTVTLMEIAEAYNKATLEANRPERSVVFVWFCGEEKGLLGSYYYSENPIFPLDKTIVNINMDMVGRVDDNYMSNPEYIYVIGSDRLSTELHQINESVNQKYTQLVLDYKYNDETDPNRFYYRSDHYNFAKNGIPSIFYFNGTHADYHRTTDDVEKINFNKMATIGQLIFHTSWELANRPTRIVADKK